MADKYVVKSSGDNYDCIITTNPVEEVHNLLCCCKGKAEECNMFKEDYLHIWLDKEEWSSSEPDKKQDEWSLDLEDGYISVYRITQER